MSELVSRREAIKSDFLRMTPEIQTQLAELEMRETKISYVKTIVRSTSILLMGFSLFTVLMGYYFSPKDAITSIDIPTEVDRHFSYSAGERLTKAVREYTFTSESPAQREESLKIFESELRNHELTDLGVSYIVSQMIQGRSVDHGLSDSERSTLKEKMNMMKDVVGRKNEITLSPNVMLILENKVYGHPVTPLAIEYDSSVNKKMFVCKLIEYALLTLGAIGLFGSLVLSAITRLINRRLDRVKSIYNGKKRG